MIKGIKYIALGHIAFWFICVAIQIFLSQNIIIVDILSVLIYAISFYVNYFIVLPLMPQRKPQQGLLLSLSLYIILSVSQLYPLYVLANEYFVPMAFVGRGQIIGGILHMSFFFYAMSSLSRLMITKFLRDKIKHEKSIRAVDQNIRKIRGEMSLNFTSDVLSVLHKNSFMNPTSAAEPIGKLSRILRYKLHKTESEYTLLSDEVKIINHYVELINLSQKKSWSVITRDETWIPSGTALKNVEEIIQNSKQDGGTVMISADEDKVWVTVK